MTRRRLRVLTATLAFMFAPVLTACGGEEETEVVTTDAPAAGTATEAMRVTSVDLGTSIDANRRVTAGDEFNPTDTIYASVATSGAGNGNLTARWKFQDGQVVDETSQPLSPTGAANTEFHISMPAGLPTGNYTVDILLNNQVVETESFQIE